MNVENIAISPLREVDDARRAVDQDERERQQRVDAARRDPADDLLENVGH
jgi:hypothetical protein